MQDLQSSPIPDDLAFRKHRPKMIVAMVVLLLAMMALLAGGAARRESVTIDEVAHVGAGVSYLQKLDLRINEEHPPLAKVLAALPLLVRGVHADYSHTSWTFSEKMFNEYLGEWVFGHWVIMRWNDPKSTIFWARLPMLLLSLLLGVVIYVYGSKLGNAWGGLLCLSAYATMPAFLVFGPLVLTDIPVTLFCVLTIWQFPEMWRSPSRGTVLRFGAALAGALLSKFSSGLLFFAFIAFALSLRLRRVPEQPTAKTELRAWRRRGWRNLAKGTLWALLIVYLVYLVLSWNQPTDSFQVIPHGPMSPVVRRLLMPPWIYVRGLFGFALGAASRPTYILGHAYSHGVWFYFPIVFLLKSPLAFLMLLLLAIAIALIVKKRRDPQISAIPPGRELHWRALWVSLLVFVAACVLSRLDLSIRHFSVPLALLILLLAPLPRMLESLKAAGWRPTRVGIWVTVVLALTSIFTAVRAYPYYFPFLNVLSMGRPGYALVNDSNLDWNQALPEVESFVQQRGLNQVLLDEYGFSEPTAYVPQAQFWSCQEASSSDGGRWAVVSAGSIADGHNCLWLMQYPHQVLAGGSMYAIQLPPVIPAAGTPGGPPLPEAYRYLGGFPFFGTDPRLIFLNCIRDPQQLEPTMKRMQAMMNAAAQKKPK